MAPRPQAYLIFAGLPDGPALWLEAVYGLERASKRVREIAQQKPGTYFIRDLHHMVLDGIDTVPKRSRPEQASRPSKVAA